MVDDGNDTLDSHPLEQNCREDWPRWICLTGNITGLCSTTLWFLVLLPQVWKNFRRKSVRGLSILWASANFTASLINLFFVFKYVSIPIYGQISSVYCPVLEFALMVQFWVYGHYRMLHKVLYLCACVVVWGTVITVELLFTIGTTIEYAAITLWCIETFPQIILNMKLQTTSGQSLGSVMIAMVGKTTDFVTNNVLVLPRQYVIMVYFSSSVAYINGLQVAWYYGNDLDSQPMEEQENTETNYKTQPMEKVENKENKYISESQASLVTNMGSNTFVSRLGFKSRGRKVDAIRIASLCVLSALLITFVAGFVWNIDSLYGLFAPVAIVLVILCARVYFWKCTSRYVMQ